MQPYSVQPSQPKISESNVMWESNVVNPNKEPPIPNALVDSSLLFLNNTTTPADPSPSCHTSNIPHKTPSYQNALALRSNFQIPSKVHPIPDNLTPAFTRLTFDAWCQQHAPLKKKISGCNKNTVVDDLLRPTTMYTTQDKFHDTTSTTHDSEFDRYPFPPQHTITTTTLFLPVLVTATRTYITILLPSTQLRIACIM